MPYYYAVVSSTINGETANPAINAFTFLTTEITPTGLGAENLAIQMLSKYYSPGANLRSIIHEDTTIDSIVVTAPQVPTVLHVETVGNAGEATGDMMPRFNAFEFKSPRSVGNIRQGKKRFGAISEGMVTAGVLNPTFLTLMQDVAADLSDPLVATVSGVSVQFTPIIVKRIPYTAPSGRTAYRLPEGLDPLAYAIADNWVYQSVTTQNSRKA